MQVDFVKITDNTLKPDIFLYAVKEAKRRGMKTSAHTPYALTIVQAADAGLSSVEHVDYLIKAGSPKEARSAPIMPPASSPTARRRTPSSTPSTRLTLRASIASWPSASIAVTPTLNMGRILAYLDREDHSKDAALAYIGPGLRKTYDWRVERAAKATLEQVAARHKEYELSKQVMPMLVAAGIPILAGTDAGYLNSFNYPGEGLHDELERYVESGLTPQQALVSATITGPAFLGHGDRYGSIARRQGARTSSSSTPIR